MLSRSGKSRGESGVGRWRQASVLFPSLVGLTVAALFSSSCDRLFDPQSEHASTTSRVGDFRVQTVLDRHRLNSPVQVSLEYPVLSESFYLGGNPQSPRYPRLDDLLRYGGQKDYHGKSLFFRDELGRLMLLRGVNFSGLAKLAPKGLPMRDMSKMPEVARTMREHGWNVVRMPLVWENIFPAAIPARAEELDQNAALNQFAKAIRVFAQYGIWVFLDLHQDLLTSAVNAGEGIPPALAEGLLNNNCGFADNTCLMPKHDRGPLWGINLSNNFDNRIPTMYANLFGSRTRHDDGPQRVRSMFARFARAVAGKLGKEPNVLGIELLNEPHLGTYTTGDKARGLPRDPKAGEALLSDFHDRIAAEIAAIDPSLGIFFEPPVSWSEYGPFGAPPQEFPTTLRRPLVSPATFTAFAPHFYDFYLFAFFSGTPFLPDFNNNKTAEYGPLYRSVREVADRLGSVGFMGEFSVPTALKDGKTTAPILPGGNHPQNAVAANYLWLDRYWLNATYWGFIPDASHVKNNDIAAELVREGYADVSCSKEHPCADGLLRNAVHGSGTYFEDGWNSETYSVVNRDPKAFTLLDDVTRPYPERMTARPIEFYFNPAMRGTVDGRRVVSEFYVHLGSVLTEFSASGDPTVPTILALPRARYRHGIIVRPENKSDIIRFDETSGALYWTLDPNQARHVIRVYQVE